MSPVCPASSTPPIRCRTRIGAMASRSAGWPLSTPSEGGVVSAGGVGFDISCGVRTLLTGLKRADLEHCKESLADSLFTLDPGRGSAAPGTISLDEIEMDRMLAGGARWAVEQGYGSAADLDRIEEGGKMPGAQPDAVSERARHRQREEMGTLGSGNHYLEVQEVTAIFDDAIAASFGLATGRCRRQHPLRVARARPPDRHRFSARDGAGGAERMASCCPISNLPARRSARSSASVISARCAPASIARSPIARSSLI